MNSPLPAKPIAPLTPMMQQYRAIKEQYQDCLLFFRLGDFYELFFEDAVEASRLLNLTLTGRGKDENRVPMCGAPYHAADGYIARLTRLGRKVAICDQLSDPSAGPGIVVRDVTRVVTPGTTFDEKVLDGKANNFVMGVVWGNGGREAGARFEVAFADVTTGEFKTVMLESEGSLRAEIERLQPAEIIVPAKLYGDAVVERLKKGLPGIFIFGHEFEGNADEMESRTEAAPLRSVVAGDFLMDYLKRTQKSSLAHMSGAQPYEVQEFMALDEATLKNLELLCTLREGSREGSLLWVLDKTETAMGGRLLRQFLTHPLVRREAIEERLEAVAELVSERALHEDLQGVLRGVMDLERLLARLSTGRGSARDLVGLKNSLLKVPNVKELLGPVSGGVATPGGISSSLLKNVHHNIDSLPELVALIERAIVADPPLNMNDGGMIADGYNGELDDLKKISREGKQFIQNLQQQEIERTGISNLKVRFNKVFGYYLEVSRGQVAKVPMEWIRKQTVVNAERYITPQLKEFEEKILGAEEKIVALEQRIFGEIRERAVGELVRIQKTAQFLALLDVMSSFAQVALENRYCRPVMNDDGALDVKGGRHPVVEKMSFDARFVPNDTVLGGQGGGFGDSLFSDAASPASECIQLITGPNMGGKSTYLRQVALITLMAHIGSFVPATQASIGVVDRIFTRVGASDNLVRGQSTFMVEMQETANILEHATARSLIILDEIGRGTSTYDGMSLAWAIMEFLHDTVGAKTLFATHYHELIALAEKLDGAANFSVAVRENAEEGVVFLYTVVRGGVDRSYGIEVAKLAGLPTNVVTRAREILGGLEDGTHESALQKELARQHG